MPRESSTPVETPLPQYCDTKTGRPCPYHLEIELIREWKKLGLGEIVVITRSRNQWMKATIVSLFICLFGIIISGIWGGFTLAADIGQISGGAMTRLEQVENRVSQDNAEIQRISRSTSDAQTTMLVTLGETREQLRSIDARLQRIEDAQTRNRR